MSQRQLQEQTRFEFNIARLHASERASEEREHPRSRRVVDRTPEKKIEGPDLSL
jgi:hypothetical protein